MPVVTLDIQFYLEVVLINDATGNVVRYKCYVNT